MGSKEWGQRDGAQGFQDSGVKSPDGVKVVGQAVPGRVPGVGWDGRAGPGRAGKEKTEPSPEGEEKTVTPVTHKSTY